MLRTQLDTVPTTQTTLRTMNMLFGNIQSLGVVAPPAGQRATFEENSCPDTGAIVDGILFYVENDAAGHN